MKNVVVIGAGPAGLTAAYELLTKTNGEYNVTVLEATSSIGGISQTVRYNGNRMDIGGHRFFSKDNRVMEWWKERLPLQGYPSYDDIKLNRVKNWNTNGPNPEDTDLVMLLRNRISRIYFDRKFFDYPLKIKLSTFINMGLFRTFKAGLSYSWSIFFKREEKSLEDFYINRFGYVLYSMFFESYTEKVWGLHPSKLSADWGAQRVRGLSITKLIFDGIKKVCGLKEAQKTETSLIEEYWYPKFGPGQLWETVADDVIKLGGKVLKNHNVTNIHCNGNKVSSVTCTVDNESKTFPADIIISSMPIRDLIQSIDANYDDNIKEIAKGLPYRDFITVGILANKLKIKNNSNIKTINNIVPDCWIYIQEPYVKVGRLQIFNNWSPYLVADPENTVWIGMEYFCTEGDELWNKAYNDMISMAIDELQAIGIVDKSNVLDSHCEKIKKAYPAYFGTYDRIDKVRDWLTEIDGLYCVGRNGQHRYNNMDHSMLTSFFAVDHILGNLKSKRDIWDVNTEKEYHETAKK